MQDVVHQAQVKGLEAGVFVDPQNCVGQERTSLGLRSSTNCRTLFRLVFSVSINSA